LKQKQDGVLDKKMTMDNVQKQVVFINTPASQTFTSYLIKLYRVFGAQADRTSTHTSHKDTEQSTIEASITLDGLTLTH
jgi:hypothetical protein